MWERVSSLNTMTREELEAEVTRLRSELAHAGIHAQRASDQQAERDHRYVADLTASRRQTLAVTGGGNSTVWSPCPDPVDANTGCWTRVVADDDVSEGWFGWFPGTDESTPCCIPEHGVRERESLPF